MVARTILLLFVIGIAHSQGMVAWAEEEQTQRTFSECFLYRMGDGSVYIGEPLVSLGMIGVKAFPPKYYLSPTLAERFAPLVNELEKTPEQPQFWWSGLPKLKENNKPLVLLRLAVKTKLRKPSVTRGLGDGHGALHEVTSADLLYAEFLSPEWRAAWDSLDSHLNRIVDISRTAPGNDKTRRLTEVIESASGALGTMVKQGVRDSWRKEVRQIDPGARVVRLFQRQVESSEVGKWGGQLRAFVATLRIQPRSPLPGVTPPCPKIELLAKSSSADQLLATIRQSWPATVLDESLIWSKELNRTVFVWQVKDLTPAQFASLRQQARDELASRQRAQAQREAVPLSEPEGLVVPEWNVTLRPASPELLAEKKLLRGTLVTATSGDENEVGLVKGDVIIDYQSVYDLVMGGFAHFGQVRQLANTARYGGKLVVLRDDRIITLTAERTR